MTSHSDYMLRPARIDDLMLYFQWANDPDVRRNAFHQEPILLMSHQEWFTRKIADNRSYLYVLEKEGVPAGQIRFDTTDDRTLEVDFSVAREFRGKGLGSVLLRLGVEALAQDAPRPVIVHGAVKRENTASCQAFLRAGFVEQGSADASAEIRHFYWRINV